MIGWDELTTEQKVAYLKGAIDRWNSNAAPALRDLTQQVAQLARCIEDLESKSKP